MGDDTRKSENDGLQSLFAVVGISLGVIPLVRVLAFDGTVGRLLSWIPMTRTSPGEWLVPVAIAVLAVAAIAVVEVGKQRG